MLYYSKVSSIAVIIFLLSQAVFAHSECADAEKNASLNGEIIGETGSGRKVLGKGRLQFYSAPDERCSMKGLFLIPGDEVFAQHVYGRFTKVAFIPYKHNQQEVVAWVLSERLAENGKGIVPGLQSQD